MIKPIIYMYGINSDDDSTQSLIYPMPYCHRKNSDFGSPQEQTDYIRYNEAHGFPTAVQTWIKNIWSFGQNMKLVSLEVNGANISKQEMHAFIWAGGRLSSSTIVITICILATKEIVQE